MKRPYNPDDIPLWLIVLCVIANAVIYTWEYARGLVRRLCGK